MNHIQDSIVGVKLLLDLSQKRPRWLLAANVRRTIKKLPKGSVEIAVDFIGAIYISSSILTPIYPIGMPDSLQLSYKGNRALLAG